MKPIIVYDIEKYDGNNNMLLIDKNKFEKLLEDTYQAGFNDGTKESKTGMSYTNNLRDYTGKTSTADQTFIVSKG